MNAIEIIEKAIKEKDQEMAIRQNTFFEESANQLRESYMADFFESIKDLEIKDTVFKINYLEINHFSTSGDNHKYRGDFKFVFRTIHDDENEWPTELLFSVTNGNVQLGWFSSSLNYGTQMKNTDYKYICYLQILGKFVEKVITKKSPELIVWVQEKGNELTDQLKGNREEYYALQKELKQLKDYSDIVVKNDIMDKYAVPGVEITFGHGKKCCQFIKKGSWARYIIVDKIGKETVSIKYSEYLSKDENENIKKPECYLTSRMKKSDFIDMIKESLIETKRGYKSAISSDYTYFTYQRATTENLFGKKHPDYFNYNEITKEEYQSTNY